MIAAMPGKTSHKRSTEETASRRSRQEQRSRIRAAGQRQRELASAVARKFSLHDVRDMRDRHERGEVYRTIGKAYGIDEFTVARVIRYGTLTPWQAAEAARSTRRIPLQNAWAKKHKQDQLSAS
jgi:hypothetical protein